MLRVKSAATTTIIGEHEGKGQTRLPKKIGYTLTGVLYSMVLRSCIVMVHNMADNRIAQG